MESFSKARDILLDIKALKNGTKLSRRRATQLYNVSESTLRGRAVMSSHTESHTDLLRDWVFKSTSNIWPDNETGLYWIQNFVSCTKFRINSVYRMVIDGHQSHKSAAFEKICHDNKIITIGVSPHSY